MASKPPSPALSGAAGARFDVANRLFFRLYQCANLLHRNGTRAVEDFGSTTQQWAALGALARPQARQGGLTVKELMAFLQLSRQNLTIVLDRLEERGVVERVKDAEDGRSRRVRLTGAGEALWVAMHEPIEAFYDAALVHLSAAEQQQLVGLFDKLRAGLMSRNEG